MDEDNLKKKIDDFLESNREPFESGVGLTIKWFKYIKREYCKNELGCPGAHRIIDVASSFTRLNSSKLEDLYDENASELSRVLDYVSKKVDDIFDENCALCIKKYFNE